MYLNKAIIIGNLTRDPELRSLPSGTSVAGLSIATNHVYKDGDGSKVESVEYHRVVVFGAQAEHCAQYLKKGSQAFVEGRIATKKWEADGVTKYSTEIMADRVQFGAKGSGKKEGGADEEVEDDITPDEVPF